MTLSSRLKPPSNNPPIPASVVGARTPGAETQSICVVEERPVAFVYNGIPYAVMMASPADMEDFALGFSLTEGIVESADDIDSIAVIDQDEGTRIELSLSGPCLHRYLARRRVRRLSGNTSCGLCGVEDLADAKPRAWRVPAAPPPTAELVRTTADKLRECQPLSRLTRGAHAAAWIALDGAVDLVREDVGRHNALDKLIGALLRKRTWRDGFCLITSRCSFEMVQKAAAAGFSTLVSISAPTTLAIRTAQAAGLTLLAISPEGIPLLYASQDLP